MKGVTLAVFACLLALFLASSTSALPAGDQKEGATYKETLQLLKNYLKLEEKRSDVKETLDKKAVPDDENVVDIDIVTKPTVREFTENPDWGGTKKRDQNPNSPAMKRKIANLLSAIADLVNGNK